MHLKGVAPTYSEMARHMHVTQCLGSLGGVEWFFTVAAPGGKPAREDIKVFRIPGDRALAATLVDPCGRNAFVALV